MTPVPLSFPVKRVGEMVGMPGSFAAESFIAEALPAGGGVVTSIDPVHAVVGDYNDGYFQTSTLRGNELAFVDDQNELNAFEAALVYTVGGSTWYIPAGMEGLTPIYDNPDDVITVMSQLIWWDSDPKSISFGNHTLIWPYTFQPSLNP